jgi:hypothetical protein
VGDLARVRWILAEMVRESRSEQDEDVDAEITEEVMMHVFHAYAAYKPPFKRTDVLLQDGTQHSQLPQTNIPEQQSAEPLSNSETLPFEHTQPTFTHIPPQSRSEVIAEAKVLFTRILEDRDADVRDPNYETVVPGDRKFKNVQLSPRLLNSYLSVHYKHSSLDVFRELFKQLFENLGVSRNARSYIEALERCGTTRRGRERVPALEFAEEVWTEWQSFENEAQDGSHQIDARMVERAHAAIIRVLSLYVLDYTFCSQLILP